MRWSGDLCFVGEFSPLYPSSIRQRYECPRHGADMRRYGGAGSSPRGHRVLGIELFLNKRERNSTVQHRRQSHRPQSALCDCGSHVPKCCSASCRQSHARQRCGPDSRLYWQPCASRSVADWDFFCSCEASSLASQSDRPASLLAYQDSLNRPAHLYL
jgi:hypothetical protein